MTTDRAASAVFCLMLVAVVVSGCSATYEVNRLSGRESVGALDRQRSVFVAVPTDGAYGSQTYAGSGQTVAQAVAMAFSPIAARIHIAENHLSNEEALLAAQKLGAGYAVIPLITQWEQRATEWSARPSRMALRVSVLDVATGKEISSTGIEGRSRIVSLASTSPQSLLAYPLEQYVRGLYGMSNRYEEGTANLPRR